MVWRCGSVLQEVKSLTAPLKSLSVLTSEFRTRGAKCDKSPPYVCESQRAWRELHLNGAFVWVGPIPEIPSASYACMHTQ